MSHLPASYDHFWWFYMFGKFHYFRQISRKSHFWRFGEMWHRREKTKKLREIIFRINFFSRIVLFVPEVGEFWVLGHFLGFWNIINTSKSRTSILFRIFAKSWFSIQNHDFELRDRYLKYIFDQIIFQTFFIRKEQDDWYLHIYHICIQSKVMNSNVYSIFL